MKNRPLTQKEIRRNLVIKWALYLLLVGVAFVYITVGGGVKPLFLIPIAICISMKERSELISAFAGTACGFLLDVSCGKTLGFNAFILTVICMLSSLVFLYIMRQNIINLIIINFIAVITQGLLDYLFFYAIWGYDDNGFIFTRMILPSMLFTILAGPVICVIFWAINRKFGPREEYFMAEQSDDIVRE